MVEDRKNICFHKIRNLWIVKFIKHNQKFEATILSLEEAISLRDKVKDFIDEHDRIPAFEEVGFKPRTKGRKPMPKQTYRFVCSRCARVTETQRKSVHDSFISSENVCGKCRLKDALDRRVTNDNPTKSNKLGIRNIRFDKRMKHYAVSITRNGEAFSCLADSLEEATSIKHTVLEFISSNNRVPSNTEGAEMFGYTARELKGSLEPSKSYNSSTGEQNISEDVGEDHYIVQISRAGRKFAMRIKNLEHAKILRNEVYDYYKTHGMLPKVEEFVERRNQLNDEIDRIKG